MNEQALARMMFRAACPNNDILFDDGGRPSVMVFIPKFRMNQVITNGSDRVHPAFIVNGKERDGFYISKYQNRAEKATKEQNRQKSQQQKTARTWGIGIAIVSILLVLSMVLSSIRF